MVASSTGQRDSLISSRRAAALQRLKEVEAGLEKITYLQDAPGLCIYVTGSYGRLEASEHSDLDLFFLHEGTSEEQGLPRLQKTLIDAEIIKLCDRLGFPGFSRDGEFLKVHHLDDMKEKLGSPKDDFENTFTARLLMLLESRPLYNEGLYHSMTKEIVDSYYRDYHDHEREFQPVFLINDISRYWRTMCLNYEHRRNRSTSDPETKNKHHLKNLKLRFSRLLTCQSAIACIVSSEEVVTPDGLLKIIEMSPLDRLSHLAEKSQVSGTVHDLTALYSWFLEMTGKPSSDALDWIGNQEKRDDAFEKSREFAHIMYRLIRQTTTDQRLQHLVV